jgi:heme a synthase
MTIVALLSGVVAATTPISAARAGRGWILGVGAAAFFTLLLIAAGSYAHDVYVSGWPLVGDQLLPPLDDDVLAAHFVHRVLAVVVFLWVAVLVIAAGRKGRQGEQRLLGAALLLHTGNIGIGAAHVFTEVGSAALIATHLSLAAVVWMCLVLATARAAGVGVEVPSVSHRLA